MTAVLLAKNVHLTRPSKQCKFRIYLDKSFDQLELSEWSIVQVGPGGPGGPGGQGGPGCQGGQGG